MRAQRLMLLIALGCGPAARAATRAAVDPLPGRRIDRLVAGPTRLFALRGGEVVTFDGGGQALGHCGGFAAPPERDARAAIGAPDAEEVLRSAGLPDDDSTPDADDALADEGLGPRRRTRPVPDVGIVPRALTAMPTADRVWIATSSGIFRGDETGCAPMGLGGRDLLAVAAADGVVIAASEDLLFRRDTDPDDDDHDDGDGGATFTVVGGLPSRPRALAVGADGEAIVADDDGVSVVGPDNTSTRILDRPTDAIAVCDGVAAVLASDGVYAWSRGAPPARVGDRPPARTLSCGPTIGERWIATGVGVWSSSDGATWVERTEMLGRSVADAAILGDRLWLAADEGLIALGASPAVAGAPGPAAWRAGGTPLDPALPALATRRLLTPTIPWPWVTAAFGTERTPDRHAWTAMVLLTFPFGRGGRRVDPTPLANEMVRRDLALAIEQMDLRAAPPGEETDARLAAVQEEREALR